MDKEALELLELILKRSFYTIEDAQEETKSTSRQVLYRLEKVNQLLNQRNKPRIVIGNQKEFLVDISTKDYLIQLIFSSNHNVNYQLDREERKLFIFLSMFIAVEHISVQHLIYLLKVSKSTVMQDLNELKLELSKANIYIQYSRSRGYYLEAREINLRKHIIEQIIVSLSKISTVRVFDMIIDSHHLFTFDFTKLIILEIANKYKINFVEERLDEFIYLFIFLTTRIIEEKDAFKKNYDIPELNIIETFREFSFTDELICFFPFRDKISQIDKEYIAAWIIGISVGDANKQTADYEIIASATNKIISRFQQISGIEFKNKEDIFSHIYAHLRPAYYRLIYNLPIINPLKEKIKNEYSSLYYLVQESMRAISDLFSEEINEDELAYITLHFAPIYLTKEIEQEPSRKKALIICLHGIGSSALLYNELSTLFPNINFLKPIGISQFNSSKYDVDIIFTTKFFKEIANSDIPFVKVNPVMNIQEKNTIYREVTFLLGDLQVSNISRENIVNVIRKHVGHTSNEDQLVTELFNLTLREPNVIHQKESNLLTLGDMIDESLIRLQVNAKTVEEALQISGNLLVNNQNITMNYVDEVIDAQKSYPSYFIISPNIALPHVKPKNNVLKTSLSVVTLEEPVVFDKISNRSVSLILFLAAKDDGTHINAMSSLLELLNDCEFINLMKKTKDKETVLQYFQGANHLKNGLS